MRRLILLLCMISLFNSASQAQQLKRPKLVVGVVIDQMRWDYLYRFYDRYDAKGGFKRLINQGFSCDNTLIPYTPTITACGHSSIFTGSVPALNGIVGNNWWDNNEMRTVYCTEDNGVNTVGSNSKEGKMSPKNLLVTTIADELRLATNFRGKTIGVALKDRGSILPAGHNANAAYWFDKTTGTWITSTYYMSELPGWVNDFNSKKLADKYFQEGWKLLYPANTYTQSTADEKTYEETPFGKSFPYDLSKYIGKDYGKLASTPMGNTITAEFAKAAIAAEKLGTDDNTDFLTVSFSSTDYIGHAFGPNSMEAEDGILRLDKDLGSLLDYLDSKVGKGQYTLFLSADHGAAHVPEFLNENKLPGGRVGTGNIIKKMNAELKEKYNLEKIITAGDNYYIYLNHQKLDSAKISAKEVSDWIVNRLLTEPGIDRAFSVDQMNTMPLPAQVRTMINNGYYPSRCGDIQIILKPGYISSSSKAGTTHGLWNPYDAHIPLLWYGWGIKPGKTNAEVKMIDIAPTVAALLHIQMPSGCIGNPIQDIVK